MSSRRIIYTAVITSTFALAAPSIAAADQAPPPPQGPPPVVVTPGTLPPGAVSPDSFSDCPTSTYWFCAWQNSGYSGGFWKYNTYYWGAYKWNYVGSSANDQFSALYNHRPHATYISKDYPPSDYQACLSADSAYANLANYAWPQPPYPGMNDSISAFDMIESDPC